MQTPTFKMLLRKRGTAESILAIALLIAILASITSVVNHLSSQAETIGNLLHIGETYIILSEDATSITGSKVDIELANLLSNATNIKYVLPQKVFCARLITASNSSYALVRGVDVPAFLEARHARINGSAAEDMQANVGELLARLASIKVGDQIDIDLDNKRVTVEVAGIIQTRTQSDTQIIVPMNVAYSLNEDNNEVSVIEFTTKNEQNEISQLSQLLPADVKIVKVQQTKAFIQDTNSQTLSFLNKWSLAVYATVTAASYVIATRLTIESTYELAMLKALGAKRVVIFKSIMIVVLTITLLGSILGLAIGISGAQILATLVRWALKGVAATPFLNVEQAAHIALFTVTSSILGCIYPAIKAMHKDYAELSL